MGSGGNEGSGSYTSAFARAIVSSLIERSMDHALTLFGTRIAPVVHYRWGESFGQFDPAGGGSAWDLILAFEGAIVLRSTVTSRAQVGARRYLASPFYFEPHAMEAGSLAPIDEVVMNKGRASPGRGEQWFPLWSTPSLFQEISQLVAEGRCSVGQRRATRSLDAARAIGQLGVARGISSFQRYGYLQRNNLATHFAVPLGVVNVQPRPRARLVDDLSAWEGRLHFAARKKTASARFIRAEGLLADAIFAVLTHDESPHRWEEVLLAAARIESLQASGTGIAAGPIPPLSADWLQAADDGSVGWRLACALGSAAGAYDRRLRPEDPVRAHWLPLERGGRRLRVKEKRLVADPRVVMTGRDAVSDCIALLERRLIESTQRGWRSLPLVSAPGCDANPSDLAQLIAGTVDLPRVLELARALMALQWDRWRPSRRATAGVGQPEEAWTAMRLATLPWPLSKERDIPVDGALIRRLRSGDGTGALEIALRRLRAAGLRPPIRTAVSSADLARRWAAALAFPISRYQARQLARPFEPARQETR